MKKIVITFGLISGLIIAALVWITAMLTERGLFSLNSLEVVGYTSMIVALSVIFFGIKSYRDNAAKGTITFWKGLQIGVLISLIASVFYWGGAMSYGLFNPGFEENFIKKFTEMRLGKLQEQGAPQVEVDKARGEIETMQTLFRNPFLFFFICLIEIFPVGIIVSLISAALLRRKELLTTTR